MEATTEAYVLGIAKIWVGEVRGSISRCERLKKTHLRIGLAVMVDKSKWSKDQPWPHWTKLAGRGLYHRWAWSRSTVQ
jgi:hypothetical protein